MAKLPLWLIIPDLHFRFHDPRYTNLIPKIITHLSEEANLKGVVQLGDFVDFWQISDFDKDPSRTETIHDDLMLYASFLDKCVAKMPKNSTWHNLEGNHEKRLHRYIARNAPRIFELVKDIPEVLRFKERSYNSNVTFKWHPYSKWDSCKISQTVFHHGFYFTQHVAAKNLGTYPCNIVTGHVHRVQFVTDGNRFSATIGHGSNQSETMHTPTPTNWSQALGIFIPGKKDRLEVISVEGGECVIWGKLFSSV